MRVYVEVHPNKLLRTFHLSKPMTNGIWHKYQEDTIPKKVKAFEKKFERCIEFADDDHPISHRVNRKSIRIGLNPAYSWDEAMAKAFKFIEAYFKEKVEYEVMDRPPEWDMPRRHDDDWY